MNVVLFEDYLVSELRPITLGRPAFDIGCAGTTLYGLIERKSLPVRYIVRDYLQPLARRRFSQAASDSQDTLFLNACVPPAVSIVDAIFQRCREESAFLAQTDHRVCAAFFPQCEFSPEQVTEMSITKYLQGQDYDLTEDRFPLIDFPFQVIEYNQRYLEENLSALCAGVKCISPGVYVGQDTHIHPSAYLDGSRGPVLIEQGATVGPFAILEGPVYVGPNSRVTERASVKGHSHIGHTCKVGGEVEASIMEPYSNKQHHGFLGHSYAGSWVNMGAGTSNSNLKNTYGEVTVFHRGEPIPTGQQFMGCILGDYSKTAINTSIFTGKTIGVSSHVYGFVVRNVPSFCNYAQGMGQVTEYHLSSAIRTQQRMFARRHITQEHSDIRLLEDIYHLTRDERMMSTDSLSL